MPVNKSWQVTVSPELFHNGVEISMSLVEERICTAMPVNGPVIRKAAPDGAWVFVVPAQIETKEEVERLLRQAGIAATVRLAA